jgi:hypothetical protein
MLVGRWRQNISSGNCSYSSKEVPQFREVRMGESIFLESLKQATSLRELVASKYSWFVHDTGFARLSEIRANGLVLRNYEPFEIPKEVKEHFGEDKCGILCFYPNGADLRPQSSQQAPHMRLAIRGSSLPPTIGLDWSYERRRVQALRDDNPDAPVLDLCLRAIQCLGSVASYSPVEPSHLRVCSVHSDAMDPTAWPLLENTSDDKIHLFS